MPLDLVAAASSLNALHKCFEDGSYANALRAIGDVQMKAAQDAVAKIGDARIPRDVLNRIVGHLEVAHVAYRGYWKECSWLRRMGFLKRLKENAAKDCWVCSLMALAHAHMGDGKKTILDALALAESAADFEPRPPYIQQGIHINGWNHSWSGNLLADLALVPSNLVNIGINYLEGTTDLVESFQTFSASPAQFTQFAKALKDLTYSIT